MKANAAQMRQMHDKLVSDIDTLRNRQQSIKSKMAVAKTQQHINKVGSSVSGAGNSVDAFSRMEAKANKALDEANAMAELNGGMYDDINSLMAECDNAAGVEDELAALKNGMSAIPNSSVDDELAALKEDINKD